ncbi:WD domain, G-beta repeat containing protein [Drechmeria coniospora]|uniref:WD domain, G-beta repeat containing protein n=1 Tax=Drechmeria coniospora TaxID=98403 RepID=A0A151GWJ3_DRECN|nr:WD domain, G-beta repeat containing protein [Drechmeria coniospora]KYK61479.1 WD domain, G-beta repeat containing protein [Drechmeria coniospora]
MSSFFTVPGAQKKRKRPAAPDAPKKRVAASKSSGNSSLKAASATKKRAKRDESSSESEDDDDESYDSPSDVGEEREASGSDEEEETAAEKRLRLAERYLENVKQHVDEVGFDAAEIDRDLIAERLQEDVAETKGRVYRQLASKLAFGEASQTFFRTNTNAVTSVAACAPYFYTTTKDMYLHKWRTQDLPQHQYPQTTRRKPKKPPAPPRKKPQLESWIRGNAGKSKDNTYKRHVGQILAVAASPDGKYVVTGGEDKKLIVYDAATLKPIKVMSHHRDAVTGLAFRRGTNQLYSSSKDRTVKVWSLDELAYVETLFGHQDSVVDIDALAQERCVSVGARDRTARLWKVMEETQLVFRGGAVDKKPRPGIDPRSLMREGSMDRIAMIDDDLFVTGSDNGAISLWSVTKKKPVYIEAFAHGIDPALAPMQASAEEHPSAREIPAPAPRWITALRTIPYSDVILSGSWDGHIRVWRLSEDKKSIEPVAVLGYHHHDDKNDEDDGASGRPGASAPPANESRRAIHGIINDITVFERGDRGKDGLCIVAAVSKEHRLGRWKVCKGVRNGGVVLEVPRIQNVMTNGGEVQEGSDEDEDKDMVENE